MGAVRQLKEKNELGGVLEALALDTRTLHEFLITDNETEFVGKIGVVLNEAEMDMLKNLKKDIIQSVNTNIMSLSEKVSKIANKQSLCNGTCW